MVTIPVLGVVGRKFSGEEIWWEPQMGGCVLQQKIRRTGLHLEAFSGSGGRKGAGVCPSWWRGLK